MAQQVPGCKLNITRCEKQLAAIACNSLGLRIVGALEFLAFKNNIRTQLRDEFRHTDVEKDRVIDDRESANAFQSHRDWNGNPRRRVWRQPDDKNIRRICRQFQKAQMARMDDIEVARDESDARSWWSGSSNGSAGFIQRANLPLSANRQVCITYPQARTIPTANLSFQISSRFCWL
ncbi:MAG TPA: hypothetical protein VJ800_09575 [Pseudolabrys sp.]|nr:hypothetical protein [Pseudolabrys sp.]